MKCSARNPRGRRGTIPLTLRPIPRDNNPLYPLPPDYNGLTPEGKRAARVNACRLWALPESTPSMSDDDKAHARVMSSWFFDRYYLHADPEDRFEPQFYDMPPLTTPAMHWALSRLWATSKTSAAVMPRGGGKTTHIRRDALLQLLSYPSYSLVYATSTELNSSKTAEAIRTQLYHNRRIADDFTPEYGGPMRPNRGDAPTGIEYFKLVNGSWFRGVSAASRLRGERPREFLLDDPEYDEMASTSMQTIRDYMERLIFKVVLPMVMRRFCGARWVGTFVSKRHYLWQAMLTVESPSGPRAVDPRFDHWARLFVPGASEDDSGALVSCWPEMWPSTRAAAEFLPGSTSLEDLRERLGVGVFNSEYLGRPGDTDTQYFRLDPAATGRHAYWFENVDALLASAPASSNTHICWVDRKGETRRVKLRDWLPTVRTFMTVDTAYTEKATSDRRCCCLMAIDTDNCLFALDIWSDQKPDQVLLRQSFEMSQRWNNRIIYVETVRESLKTYKLFESAVATKLGSDLGFVNLPAVKPLRPGTMSKTEKISAALSLRFDLGLVKFPLHHKGTPGAWRRLFDQIESFNPEASDNAGLEKDDEIDTVSMHMLVIAGRLAPRPTTAPAGPIDPVQWLREGRYTLPDGTPTALAVPFELLDEQTVRTFLDSRANAPTGKSLV